MIVLDTHAWLWWVDDSPKLPRKLKRRLASERELAISAISCWEVGMLVEYGRLRFTMDVRSAIRDALAAPKLRVVAVSEAIAMEAGLLGSVFHGDPADRIIAATAKELDAPLATRDERIRASKMVRTLW